MHTTSLLKIALLLAATTAVSVWCWHANEVELSPAVARVKDASVAQHSFHAPLIQTSSLSTFLEHWSIGGHAVVADKYVRLTPHSSSKTGFVTNDEPNQMSHWEVAIGFRIGHPQSASTQGADGFGFWYTQEHISTDGRLLGHPENFVGLAVLVDTYENRRGTSHGKIVATVNGLKGQTHQVPLTADDDFEDKSGGRAPYGSCMTNAIRRVQGWTSVSTDDISVLYVRYAPGGVLTVSLQQGKNSAIESCTQLSGVFLPTNFFFQFSAATGGLSDQHDIVFFYAKPLYEKGESAANGKQMPTHEHDYEEFEKKYDHKSDKEQQHAWREKTPEELAKEAEVHDIASKEAERMREESEARMHESQRLAGQRQRSKADRKASRWQKMRDLAAQLREELNGEDGAANAGGGAAVEKDEDEKTASSDEPVAMPEEVPTKLPAEPAAAAAASQPPPAYPSPSASQSKPDEPAAAVQQQKEQSPSPPQQQQQQKTAEEDRIDAHKAQLQRMQAELEQQQKLLKAQQDLFEQQQKLKVQEEELKKKQQEQQDAHKKMLEEDDVKKKQQQEEHAHKKAEEAHAAHAAAAAHAASEAEKQKQRDAQLQLQQQKEQKEQDELNKKRLEQEAAEKAEALKHQKMMEDRRREDLERSQSPQGAAATPTSSSNNNNNNNNKKAEDSLRAREERIRKLEAELEAKKRQIEAGQGGSHSSPMGRQQLLPGDGAAAAAAGLSKGDIYSSFGGPDETRGMPVEQLPEMPVDDEDEDDDDEDDLAAAAVDPNADPAVASQAHLRRAEEASAKREYKQTVKKKRENGRKWKGAGRRGGKKRK